MSATGQATVFPEKLKRLERSEQREMMGKDVDLRGLSKIAGKFNIQEAITSGEVERTIEGSSTLTFDILDRDRTFLNGGTLTVNVDIELDGLWWRLVRVEKTDDILRLTFEDREIALLRAYPKEKQKNKRLKMNWGDTTRTKFARRIVKEVEEVDIRFICPELKKQKPIGATQTQPDTTTPGPPNDQNESMMDRDAKTNRDPGLNPNERLTIKTVQADPIQLENCSIVIDVGKKMGARRKVLVCAIMTIIQESTARTGVTVYHKDLDSVGLFQQRASQGWPATGIPAVDATEFYKRAMELDRIDPNRPYTGLCQAVQGSAHPEAYDQWRVEAERIVTAWGSPGRDDEDIFAIFGTNNQFTREEEQEDYQFYRGNPTQNAEGKTVYERENSWDCLQRLANEVNWRCFMVTASCYFISEPELFLSKPRAKISERSPGVNWINFEYDTGKKNANVTVSCRIDRWESPPGTIVLLDGIGPLNGRWLVVSVRRDLFSSDGTITLRKPRPKLPEPTPEQESKSKYDEDWWEKVTGNGDQPVFPATGMRARILAAAMAGVKSADSIHYTQDARRMQGVREKIRPPRIPSYEDCSSFATWCYWAAGAPDPNGLGYNGQGYTGTQTAHGRVVSMNNRQPGDLIFYGGPPATHVAIVAEDTNKVISHGSEGGPYLTDIRYRSDILEVRSYVDPEPIPRQRGGRGGV